MQQHKQLTILIEASFMAVLSFIFALIPLDIGSAYEIELGMIPIIIFSYRRGLKYGLLSGFLWGCIKLVSGDFTMLSILQVLLEYIFAFAMAGMAGLAYPKIQAVVSQKKVNLSALTEAWSIGLAVLCKYGIHFIAGVIYWGMYAPEGMSPYLYSFIVNGSSAFATFLLTYILIHLLLRFAPRLIQTH
ncbi:energy-coupled thiamine transporter ThiT [Ignavigranum ruoffiae]|uniref:energy-coupled thiamine transporter ThiT n=1 Tax=Ignavigranum ruoffiae TaxID=89093 RepID=UPI0024AE3522|nr:energy-coupled thiamine transporter ThiT [Ignavigranum ruoffiae]